MEIQDKYPIFDYDPKKMRGYLFSDECPDYVSGKKYLNIAEKKARNWGYTLSFDKNRDLFYETILNYWPRIWEAASNYYKDNTKLSNTIWRAGLDDYKNSGMDLSNENDVKKMIETVKKEPQCLDDGLKIKMFHIAFRGFIDTICSEIDDLKQELNYLLATEQFPKECSVPSQSIQKESDNGLEKLAETSPDLQKWEDLMLRLGLHLTPDKTFKVFRFLGSRNLIESLTLNDGKPNWVGGYPFLRGFLAILSNKGLLERGHIKNAADSFLVKGVPAKMTMLRKSGGAFPFKAELDEILNAPGTSDDLQKNN